MLVIVIYGAGTVVIPYELSGSQLGAIFVPQETFGKDRGLFRLSHPRGRVPPASSGETIRMLLNTLPWRGEPPTAEDYQDPRILRSRTPALI